MKSKRDRKTGDGRLHELVREPILSGDGSISLWRDINEANSIPKLRVAIYHLGCKCQQLEAEIRRLSTEKLTHRHENK